MWGSATGFLSASEAKRDCVADKLYSRHGGWTIILTDSNTDNGNRSVVSRLSFFFIEKFYHPSKHDISTQCRTNVGPPSTPLAQHWSSTGSMCRVCWDPCDLLLERGGGPRVVVSTAAFHARVRGSVPGLGGLKETKLFLPHPRVKVSIVGSLRDREVACSASDRQGSNFESCVWRTVSSQSSHHPQEVLLAQFSLYVHKGGLKPDSFHFISGEICGEGRPI